LQTMPSASSASARFVNLIWPLLMLSFGPTWSSFRLLAQTLFFGSIPLLLGT